MGITQQIGASSLIKPGVIDNTAARPASPYEGQVIFQKDTDQLLVWNGTAWVIPNSPAQNPPGLLFIKTQSFSSTTNVTSCFSSTYDVYKIILNDIVTDGDVQIGFRMLSGTTAASGASTYGVQRLYVQTSSVGGSKSTLDYGRFGYAYSIANNKTSYEATVYSPFKAQYTGVQSGSLYSADQNVLMEFNNSQHLVNTSYDGIQIYIPSGTATGTVSVYGFRN
jgi:hypothetical protein